MHTVALDLQIKLVSVTQLQDYKQIITGTCRNALSI